MAATWEAEKPMEVEVKASAGCRQSPIPSLKTTSLLPDGSVDLSQRRPGRGRGMFDGPSPGRSRGRGKVYRSGLELSDLEQLKLELREAIGAAEASGERERIERTRVS
ncbi:hypothetical protein TIFTF001_014001 [Ficus carica]|uniref:Uncharacterized protein n=1 Tax=Ficus carica TaxID=3494 RepID=A0AA88D7S5_FICCA|nr:hypothetical protein TIFTF001_014001 [Ficus carica]